MSHLAALCALFLVVPLMPPFEVPPAATEWPQGARAARWEELWKRSGPGGRVSVRDLPGNGGRPVAVHLPEGFDPARPVRVLTYFHGHGGDIGPAFAGSGVFARLRWLGAEEAGTVVIAVEAAAKPFTYWMTPPREGFAALQRQAVGEAARLAGQSLTIASRVVSAHSGGGLALRNAVVSGQFAADALEFLDCNYGDWGMVIARWAAAQPHRPRIATWNTPGPTRVHDGEIKAAFPDLVTVTESPVGHHQIPGRLLGATLVD
jgi:hypothetical protein